MTAAVALPGVSLTSQMSACDPLPSWAAPLLPWMLLLLLLAARAAMAADLMLDLLLLAGAGLPPSALPCACCWCRGW